jgi:glycogen phosphorylase
MAPLNTSETDALIVDVLRHRIGKDERAAKLHDWYKAAILAIRDEVIDHWIESTRRTYDQGSKRVYYLSMEFLIGRLLRDALSNMGEAGACRARAGPGRAGGAGTRRGAG